MNFIGFSEVLSLRWILDEFLKFFFEITDLSIVAATPFDDIPIEKFRMRMIVLSIALFVFFFLAVGVVANSSAFRKSVGPSEVIPFWQSAIHHYQSVSALLVSIPSFCWSGNYDNEFQAHQCTSFWEDVAKQGGLALLPLFIVILFFWLASDDLKGHYRKIQNKIKKGEKPLGGKVTAPPEGPTDFYSWFYCLRPIMVQLNNQQQVKVYVSMDYCPPGPGTQLIFYEMGKIFGVQRRVAMVYAPHVAVVRG